MAIPAMFAKKPPAPAAPAAAPAVIVSSTDAASTSRPAASYVPAPNDIVVRYPPAGGSGPMTRGAAAPGTNGQGHCHLLEIGTDLEKEIERLGKDGKTVSLIIKGRPSDDAVLCTKTRTYALRSITVSNSLLIMQSPSTSNDGEEEHLLGTSKKRNGSSIPFPTVKRQRTRSTSPSASSPAQATLELRATSHEILEAQPSPPRLERLVALLRPSAWEGLDARAGEGDLRAGIPRGPGRRWTRRKLESVIQASDAELEKGLRERKVIEQDGDLMLLPAVHLVPLLSILLNLLTLHGETPESLETQASTPPGPARCPTAPLLASLDASHSLPRSFVNAVLALFGEVDATADGAAADGGVWSCDVRSVVRAIGEGLLWKIRGQGSGASVECGTFLDMWKEEVGAWSEQVELSLLEGEYLLNAPTSAAAASNQRYHTLVPFPSSLLPADPPTRFTELFLTRPRWRPDAMRPFLRGLLPDAARTGGDKALDKLVVKYVRVSKEGKGSSEVTWWYPRRT